MSALSLKYRHRRSIYRLLFTHSNSLALLLDYTQYHTRYSTLNKQDFFDEYHGIYGDDWKGQCLNITPNHVEFNDISNIDYEVELNQKAEKYYRKIIELANQNDIPILISVAPCYLSDEEQAKLNTAERIANEYDVDFVNFNLKLDEMDINFDSDYNDTVHMTVLGAANFTRHLGSYIVSKYKLPNHKGDLSYTTWENWARKVRQYENNQRLLSCNDVNSITSLIYNPYYITFISVDGEVNSSFETLEQFLNFLGISEQDSNGIWMIKECQIACGSSYEDIEEYYSTFDHDFCIKHSSETNENTVIIDNITYEKKVEHGINVVVYDTISHSVIDTFGIDYYNGCPIVR